MKIRKAKIEDARKIAEINVETWQNAYKGLIDDAILEARKVDGKRISDWEKNIQNPAVTVLVCEDEEITGYLCAGPARDDFGIENEIYALYVHPTAQRKGYGSELIKKYKQIIKYRPFYLYMLKNNQKAADFYVKNGGRLCEKLARDLTVYHGIIAEECYVFEEKRIPKSVE